MSVQVRHFVLAGVLLLSCGPVACAGGGDSSDVVTSGGSRTISKSTLEHWTAAETSGRASSEALRFLISAQRTLAQAERLGVKATDAEARRQLAVLEYSQREGLGFGRFPLAAKLESEFAHAQPADRLWLMRLAVLSSRIAETRQGEAERAIGRRAIASYYTRNKREFVLPERRDLTWIVTFSDATLRQAMREVAAGKSLLGVAERVSLDPPTISGLAFASSSEKFFAKRVFAAKPHTLVGPFVHPPDHFALEVTRVVPAHQETLRESEAAIRHRLGEQRLASLLRAEERSGVPVLRP